MNEEINSKTPSNSSATDIAKAFKLQEELRKRRKELREIEAEYNALMESLVESKVERIGFYELVIKMQKRRAIDSGLFRARWPDIFNKIAKVTLKDAENNLRSEELINLDEVIKVEQSQRYSIISYEQPFTQKVD